VRAPELDAVLPAYVFGDGIDATRSAAAVRRYVEDLLGWLARLHSAGSTGREINVANSDATDRLVRRLQERAEAGWYALGGDFGDRYALAAVGGYARRELSIGSDVDILFLVAGEVGALAAHVAERVQYGLWDGGVKLGASVRTVAQCIELGREDVSACTAILGARFLGGDPTLFHELTAAVRTDLIPDPEAFVVAQREAFERRHDKYGESLYLLQPNLKEGAGGLRDYHAAFWVARACEPMVRGPGDFLHVGLLREAEMREYDAALQFLWRLRNELHLLPGQKTDQMSFEIQEELAGAFGYGEPESGGEDLPVERFMRKYYRHARAVQTLSEIVMEQCQARVRQRPPERRLQEVEEGFRISSEHLEIPHTAHLRERPARLLAAFAVAQDHDVPLSRKARRLIRENLTLVDDAFRRNPESAELFLRILGSECRVTRSLLAMNETGLLGRYLPEWEHIVCRWQHVAYHTYTVDVHSIFLVEQLRRLLRGKFARTLPALTELIHSTTDLPALYLGCLLHDIGKGRGGDHSAKGARLARSCLERLGLAAERAERAIFLVEKHLLMSHVAQRRDLGDPKVIVEFARSVGDRENLRNLYLTTFADIRASSATAWNPWRGELLAELFERTSEFLETGDDDSRRALEQVEARVETRRRGARTELQKLGVAVARIEAFFEMMPRRYFVNHTPRQIARHARVVFSLPGEKVLASGVREMRAGFSELIICTRDVHALYASVAGCLTALGVNILASHVYTTRTGLALEVYRVSTPRGGDEERREVFERLRRTLEQVLRGDARVETLLARRGRPVGAVPRLASRRPPAISIRNDVSDFYTVVDITANDRLGLLYDLTRTLADHDLAIFVSKASTVLDQVADTFYVKAPNQAKLMDRDATKRLRKALLEVLSSDRSAPGSDG